MEIVKKKMAVTTGSLKPLRKAALPEKRETQSISTRDLGSERLKRDHLLSQATPEELDSFVTSIEERVAFENETVVSRCSRPGCGFTLRLRRKALGMACPQCSRRVYQLEGDQPELDGRLEEIQGRELEAFLKEEEAETARVLKKMKEADEARAILGKAGIR